ncbi:MAG TPA: hypothetical protein VKU93_00190 [Terracidiphilus sp.]|nr:hypothetical protein [Terracidiphilus sp.]
MATSPNPAPASPNALPSAASTAPEERRAEAERELKQEERQRMLGVVPAFTAVFSGRAVPLSSSQKFRLALADGVDPFDFSVSAFDAALEQKNNEFPAYGSGWAGYARRYGASYADDFDGELWSEGILPSILHQDPRYFRLGRGSFRHRLGYSLLAAVRARGDNGQWQFNASNIGGNLIAGAISNAYYPAADRGAGLTLQRGSIDIAEGLVQLVANEFYPDVSRALFHRRKKPAPLDTAGP